MMKGVTLSQSVPQNMIKGVSQPKATNNHQQPIIEQPSLNEVSQPALQPASTMLK
jgi:hypothetical protein